jgi:surface carbohydrate biosynthesis protein (TIGR04326 family)
MSSLNKEFAVSFKAHPGCPINLSLYTSIEIELVNHKLEFLLPKFDVIFASSNTSAAVDGYSIGLAVITLLDGEQLNLSPLRNCEGAIFVENHLQLRDYLTQLINKDLKKFKKSSYFNLDSNMSSWNKLLSSSLNIK